MGCIMDKYNGNSIDDCMRILIPFDIRNIVYHEFYATHHFIHISTVQYILLRSFTILCDM